MARDCSQTLLRGARCKKVTYTIQSSKYQGSINHEIYWSHPPPPQKKKKKKHTWHTHTCQVHFHWQLCGNFSRSLYKGQKFWEPSFLNQTCSPQQVSVNNLYVLFVCCCFFCLFVCFVLFCYVLFFNEIIMWFTMILWQVKFIIKYRFNTFLFLSHYFLFV